MNQPISKESKESQKKLILQHLQKGETVTSMWGFKQGIVRLTNRIGELRTEGHEILDKWLESESGSRYKEYFLAA